jgi:hypothetical protein
MPTPKLFIFNAILATGSIVRSKGSRLPMKYFRKKTKQDSGDDVLSHEESSFNYEAQSHTPSNAAADDLSVSLRAEMLPASKISPDLEAARFTGISLPKIGVLLGFILLLIAGWFLYAGPGRPALEALLAALAPEPQVAVPVVIATSTVTEAAPIPTNTVRAMNTPTRTPPPLPSATTLAAILDTPTTEPSPSPSPTEASGCVDVLTVTLEDVGKTICVRGEIQNFEARPTGFLIAFSNQKGAMYWVSYDLVWEPAKKGLCVELTAEVLQIASSPIMIFGYQNLPVICTTP